MDPYTEHACKCDKLAVDLAAAHRAGVPVALGKRTSNLFRHRDYSKTARIDVRGFNRVLHIDPVRQIADVEGMIPYDMLVAETLRQQMLPAVVPQLKSITVGGAVSGLGIESSSFRFGLVHETVEAMEILLGDGTIVICSASENPDLFYGFPNSYGTLGYALRLKIRLIPAKRYVHLVHTRFSQPDAYFARIASTRGEDGPDYLDGTVFSASEMYLTEGRFDDHAPYTSDYTYLKIYYQSIRREREDWLTANDYIWRWDTDWFWCSKHFYVEHPVVRCLATKWALNSRTYQRIMRLSHQVRPHSSGTESVIQDVDIPIEHAAEFLEFLFAEIGITPVWICPFQSRNTERRYDLYAVDPAKIYINFGFWDVVPTTHPEGHFNRKIEQKLVEWNGKKGLYSSVYFDESTFWTIYNQPRYRALKAKYDPAGVFPDLYAKCTLRA